LTSPSDPLDLTALSPMAREIATTIARVVNDVALVVDSQGVIQSVAEGSPPFSPRSADWVGMRWADVASQHTRGKIDLLLEEARSGGVTRRREVNHPGAGGEEIPVAWTAIQLGDAGPFIAVGRDLRAVAAIQQRFVEAQHELERDYWQRQQSEQRYRMLFHVARDAVLVVDGRQFEITEANQAAADLLGSDPTVMAGLTLVELLPAGARRAIVELLTHAMMTGRAGEIRLRLTGEGEPIDVSATPFRAGEHQQLLVQGRRSDTLPAGGDDLQSLRREVESSPEAVVVTDSAGRVLMANEAFAALGRYADESGVRGRRLQETLGDVDHGWSSLLTQARQRGLVARVPLRVRSGASLLALEATATMLTDGEKECVGITLRASAAQPPVARGWDAAELHVKDVLDELNTRLGQAPMDDLLTDASSAIERHLIELAVRRCDGDMNAAAGLLGLSPAALEVRLQRLALLVGDSDGGNLPPAIN
jgi:transcriptional regulator PpsR